MVYKIYKMTFHSAHFGEGSLDESNLTFAAHRLYSALVLEAIKLGKYEEFIALSESDEFVLSDAFPYHHHPFLPKPIGYPLRENLDDHKSVLEIRQEAKKSKKLAYLEWDLLGSFLDGNLFENRSHASHSYQTKNQPDLDGGLYQVGIVTYHSDHSLYVVARQSDLLDEVWSSLQFSGLGGKRTSGYGRFDLEILDLPSEFSNRLTVDSTKPVLLLTTALPIDEDLEEAMKTGKYLLKKSSGFAFSQSVQENYRKQDLYSFKAGSTFVGSFRGSIHDVRPKDFPHPVHHFAKPLFYELEV